MFLDNNTPDEAYWMEVGGDGRIHPYAMHREVNRNDVEVVSSVTDEDNHPKRWVLIKDGTYEAWVQAAETDEYGYHPQPEERVSESELDAISLKHAAIQDGGNVAVEEAKDMVDTGNRDQVRHAFIALYYAAKADSEIPDEDVDTLREAMHEHTRHVDTNHLPTLKGILEDGPDTAEKDGAS